MTLRATFKNRVTVRSPDLDAVDAFDEYGNPTPSQISTEHWVSLISQGSSEDETDRETRTQQFMMISGPEVDITHDSWVEWEDFSDTFHEARVVGEPQVQVDQYGQPHHIETTLTEVLG